MKLPEIISILLAVISFLTIFILAWRTDLLKELPKNVYSFRKFQLWLWTLVICPLFCLNWGCHPENIPDLNQTALILLGISAGTTVVGEMVSATQTPSKATKLDTKGFWKDILSDEDGQVSLARLQQLIFTFVFIVIFIFRFFDNNETFPANKCHSKFP